jgi:hypothetical protein
MVVCTENAGAIVMQSTEERMRMNDPRPLNRARDRQIFIQGPVCSNAVVQRRLRTPTGPFFARFSIGIILGCRGSAGPDNR